MQNHTVSSSQPFIRSIVQKKNKNPMEFRANQDISITNGYAWIEKIPFGANYESKYLIVEAERYDKRTRL